MKNERLAKRQETPKRANELQETHKRGSSSRQCCDFVPSTAQSVDGRFFRSGIETELTSSAGLGAALRIARAGTAL